jgi:hypothetical protein
MRGKGTPLTFWLIKTDVIEIIVVFAALAPAQAYPVSPSPFIRLFWGEKRFFSFLFEYENKEEAFDVTRKWIELSVISSTT